MNRTELSHLLTAWREFSQAGGKLVIDGDAISDGAGLGASACDMDSIDANALMEDLRTLKMQMEVYALNNQYENREGKATLRVNTRTGDRTASW